MSLFLMGLRARMSPHALAERLIEDRLEAERGRADTEFARWSLSPEAQWLERHLASCPRCQERLERGRSLAALLERQGTLRAPSGFVDRVRVQVAARAVSPSTASTPGRWWGFLGFSVAAAGIAASLVVLPSLSSEPPFGRIEGLKVGGAAHLPQASPHFRIRASHLGPARLRSWASSLIDARGGSISDVEGGVRVVVPRTELVAIMADLERQGGFRVDLLAEPEDDVASIVLRFELD